MWISILVSSGPASRSSTETAGSWLSRANGTRKNSDVHVLNPRIKRTDLDIRLTRSMIYTWNFTCNYCSRRTRTDNDEVVFIIERIYCGRLHPRTEVTHDLMVGPAPCATVESNRNRVTSMCYGCCSTNCDMAGRADTSAVFETDAETFADYTCTAN